MVSETQAKVSNAKGGTASPSVTVIGAGVVGMACACYLQRAGFAVTVIDRLGPGEACSYGNSGGLAVSHIEPIGSPGVLARVPGWLFDPQGPLKIRWRHLPHMAPWIMRLLQASTPASVRDIKQTLVSLLGASLDAWQPLLDDGALHDEVMPFGTLNLYQSEQALDSEMAHWQEHRELGMVCEQLSAGELHELEPDLPPAYRCAILEPAWRRVRDPHALVTGLAAGFVARGGRLLCEQVSELALEGGAVTGVRTHRGLHRSDYLVVAAGVWSNRFSAQLGDRVPLESGRGSNVTIANPGLAFQHLIISRGRARFSMSSMSMGLRIGTGMEFGGVDRIPDYATAKTALGHARKLFPQLRSEDGPKNGPDTEDYALWAGDRPMTPDTLPVIDTSSSHANVFYAFGHGQVGLTTAAITGKLVAELVGYQRPSLDLMPFRVARFR